MAPDAHRNNGGLELPPKPRNLSFTGRAHMAIRSVLSIVNNLIFNPTYFSPVSFLFLIAEVIISLSVIHNVKLRQSLTLCTGIFWLDFRYPAGHLYIYTCLYYLTELGQNISRAQYIFAAIYLALIFVVTRIYAKSGFIPPYCLIFLCLTAYRVHSVCLLRLFNDPVAMLFLCVSIWFMLAYKWTTACIFFSFAVSVKMNILLFGPGLLVILIASCGYRKTVVRLAVCAVIQLLLGAPFILTNPTGYISRAFNFGRVFFYKWTVNWRFLPEDIFLDRRLHVALLLGHILVLLAFAFSTWLQHKGSLKTVILKSTARKPLEAKEILFILFSSNFIGIMFSRSLHYQFYVWYFHTLPFLIWSIPTWSFLMRLSILGLIELSWNTYPSTNWSSMSLHICHFLILHGLWRRYGKPQSMMRKME